MSIFGTGVSGLQAAQLGLLTTEHNIANASTAGFNRQRTVQASNLAMVTGAGFVGQGTHVSTISRVYSSFLSGQVNNAQSASSELATYHTEINRINNMLADSDVGVSPALQEFFKGVQQVSANPALISARQAMLSSAQALVARYQAISGQIGEIYDNVNNQITTAVGSINSYSTQIASLNQSIIVAQSSVSQPANDLLDQRDALVLELNKLIKITTTTNRDGTFNVFSGNGQQLVVGTQSMELTSQPSGADPTRFVVGLKTFAGSQELPESLITGGTLGGLIKFRSEALDHAANDLGRNAAALALTLNAQNALGQDLLGQSAGVGNFAADLFKLSPPTVLASNTNNNVSAAIVSASFATPSSDGSYSLSLNGASTLYTLTRQADGQTWTGAGANAALSLADLIANVPAAEGLTFDPALSMAANTTTPIYGAAANGANFYTKLTASDYQLKFDGANYSMTRLSDNTTPWTSGTLAGLSAMVERSEGFKVKLDSGALSAGDSFVIRPTRDAAKNLSVNPTVAADVRLIAAALPVRTAADVANTGTGKISGGETLPGYQAPVGTVSFVFDSASNSFTISGLPGESFSVSAGGKSTIYDASASIPYTPGAKISFAGVSFDISGNLNHGDKFTLGVNAAGVSDGRNALAVGQLQSQKTMSGKTASFQSAYAQLVSDAGNKSREIEVKGQAQTALLKQAQDSRDSLSGVNLDEEATNLLRYQQAYQASAKILQIGNELFDDLLSVLG